LEQKLDLPADLKIKLEKCENDQRSSADLNIAYKEKINEYEAKISDLQNELQKKTAEFAEALEKKVNSLNEFENEKSRVVKLNLANEEKIEKLLSKITELENELEKKKVENNSCISVLDKHTNSLKDEEVGSEKNYEREDDEELTKIESELDVAKGRINELQSDLKIMQEESDKLTEQLNQSIEENKTLTVTIDEFKVEKVRNMQLHFITLIYRVIYLHLLNFDLK
jgi:chromosome segregation ATPase